MIATITMFAATVLGFILLATRRNLGFLILLGVVMFSQNIVVMILLKVGAVQPDAAWRLLMLKEILLAIALVWLGGVRLLKALVRGRVRFDPMTVAVLAWVAFLAVHALAFGPPWLARAAGFRSLAILPALYLLGSWLELSLRKLRVLLTLLFGLGLLLATFGLLEAYVLPQDFWLSIGQEEFYNMKIGRPIQGSLYGNMRFWLDGTPIRRIASVTADPLISSYPLTFLLVLMASYVWIYRRTRRFHLAIVILLTIATVLTFSRGAILAFLVAVALTVIASRSAARMALLTAGGLILVSIVTLTLGNAILSVTTGKGHINELVDGLERGIERPIGFGLGTASSVATGAIDAKGIRGVSLGGGDSYLGSAATQVGMIGAIAFYALMTAMMMHLAQIGAGLLRTADKLGWLYAATATMLGGLIVTSVVNESGLGFVSSGLTFIIAGVLASYGSLLPRTKDTRARQQQRRTTPRHA